MPTHPFELVGSGGLPLRGDLHVPTGTGPHAIVVGVHGFKGFRRWGFWPAFAEAFASAGFAFVRFDTTHNGVGAGGLDFDEEDLFAQNTWAHEEEDLDRVLTAVRAGDLLAQLPGAAEVDPGRLALLGHSRGGGHVVVHAARDAGVRATVALAPIATILRFPPDVLESGRQDGFIPIKNTRTGQVLRFGRAAVAETDARTDLHDLAANYAAELATPLLVCHGSGDTSVPPAEGRRLADAAPLGRFVDFVGADHVLGCRHPFSGTTPHFDRFVALSIDFLREHVG